MCGTLNPYRRALVRDSVGLYVGGRLAPISLPMSVWLPVMAMDCLLSLGVVALIGREFLKRKELMW